MATTMTNVGQFHLRLTDGYLSEPDTKWFREGTGSLESRVADHLCGLVRKMPRCGPPRSKQIWVLGTDNWMADAPEYFQELSEQDNDPSYRIIIAGLDMSPHGEKVHFGGWSSWTYSAGMKRKKVHASRNAFHERSELLLHKIGEYYQRIQSAPTEILDQYGVPLAYSGDYASGDNHSDPELGRIQQ